MSSYVLDGSICIDLKVGGTDIEIGANFFNDIIIVENIYQLVPTLSLSLSDHPSQTLRSFHMTDGMPIEISIGRSKSDTTSNELALNRFVVFGGSTVRKKSTGHFSDYNCVLDAPRYLGQAARLAVNGTSNEVLAKICNNCGLTPKLVATNDKQIWVSAGQTYGQWAKRIVQHGYINEQSCLMLGLTEQKELHYVDIINRLLTGKPVKVLHYSIPQPAEKDAILIYDNTAKTQSGLLNNWSNYGYFVQADGINKSETLTSSLILKKEPALAQSVAIREQVSPARIESYAFDCGNTHSRYNQAFYQNFKGRASFTESLSVIVLDYSGLSIFDVVDVRIGHGESVSSDLTSTSGNYLVAAKTKILRNGLNYGERLELVRNSVRTPSPLNPLVS